MQVFPGLFRKGKIRKEGASEASPVLRMRFRIVPLPFEGKGIWYKPGTMVTK